MSGSLDNASTVVLTVEVDRTEYDQFKRDFGQFKDTMASSMSIGSGGKSFFGGASQSSIRQSLTAMQSGLRSVNALLSSTMANMRAISAMPVTIKIAVDDSAYQRFKADLAALGRTAGVGGGSGYRPPHIPVPGIPTPPGAWRSHTLHGAPRTLGNVLGITPPSPAAQAAQTQAQASQPGPGGSINVYSQLNSTLMRTNQLLAMQGGQIRSNSRALQTQGRTWTGINRTVYNINNTFRNMRSMGGMGLITSLFGLLPMLGGAVGGGIGSILGPLGGMAGGGIGRLLGGLVGGIGLAGVGAGVAGFYGMSRLSDTVSAGRRSSLGLGVGYGQNQAFSTNFQQYVDPAAALERTANVRNSWQHRWVLSRLGLSPGEINDDDPSTLLTKALPRIRSDFNRGGQSMEYAHAMGLDQLLSQDELRRLGNISETELQNSLSSYRKDSGTFNLDPATQAAWNQFNIQLRRSGQTIETTLIRGLTPLAGPLDKLTKTVSDDISLFLTHVTAKDIDALGEGITSLATYLTGDKIKSDITWFGDKLSDLGTRSLQLVNDFVSMSDGIHNFLVRHGLVSDPSATGGTSSFSGIPAPPGYRDPWVKPPGTPADMSIADQHIDYDPNIVAKENASIATHPVSPAFQHEIFKLEGGWDWKNNKPRISPAGAVGFGQMMPGTFARFGRKGGDINNMQDNMDASTAYMQYLLVMFRGNALAAAAAYNAGEGNKGVLQYSLTGDDRYLPKETQGYVRNFSKATGAQFGDAFGPHDQLTPSYGASNPANAPRVRKAPNMTIPSAPQAWAPGSVHVTIDSRPGSDFVTTIGQVSH